MFTIHSQNLDLKQIADSGQCFRMIMESDTRARVIARGRLLYLTDKGKGEFELSCTKKEYNDIWHDYLDMGNDYEGYIKAVDPEDAYLKKAALFGQGIRILRQEPFETLISFIISQRKNIPAIQSSVEKLCRLCGERIKDEHYAFPSPKALSSLSLSELSDCSLGYRAPYVKEAAMRIASGEADLKAMNELSDKQLFDELVSLYGVGKKVANCVMLFAYHRIGAFPVDVWIKRIEDAYYNGRFP
ncbi:MAG: DNA-3-methyladenine glycosylase 2 family protein, partial [Lachnospiraceae bacterium]|nr:DNA-3-methyladenine glycosylase 2 family protein [Lachnospiraceae bacterium]